jgi:hypothetical protein
MHAISSNFQRASHVTQTAALGSIFYSVAKRRLAWYSALPILVLGGGLAYRSLSILRQQSSDSSKKTTEEKIHQAVQFFLMSASVFAGLSLGIGAFCLEKTTRFFTQTPHSSWEFLQALEKIMSLSLSLGYLLPCGFSLIRDALCVIGDANCKNTLTAWTENPVVFAWHMKQHLKKSVYPEWLLPFFWPCTPKDCLKNTSEQLTNSSLKALDYFSADELTHSLISPYHLKGDTVNCVAVINRYIHKVRYKSLPESLKTIFRLAALRSLFEEKIDRNKQVEPLFYSSIGDLNSFVPYENAGTSGISPQMLVIFQSLVRAVGMETSGARPFDTNFKKLEAAGKSEELPERFSNAVRYMQVVGQEGSTLMSSASSEHLHPNATGAVDPAEQHQQRILDLQQRAQKQFLSVFRSYPVSFLQSWIKQHGGDGLKGFLIEQGITLDRCHTIIQECCLPKDVANPSIEDVAKSIISDSSYLTNPWDIVVFALLCWNSDLNIIFSTNSSPEEIEQKIINVLKSPRNQTLPASFSLPKRGFLKQTAMVVHTLFQLTFNAAILWWQVTSSPFIQKVYILGSQIPILLNSQQILAESLNYLPSLPDLFKTTFLKTFNIVLVVKVAPLVLDRVTRIWPFNKFK